MPSHDPRAFDGSPTLVGERVTIRPLAADDWEALYEAAADPAIWALHPASDRHTEPVFREFFDGALASGSAFVFVDRATGRVFGSSRYHGHDPALSEIEIGWTFLARDYWGGSFNREIKSLMLEHAFRFVDTALFFVGETNWRSQGAMEKIGGLRRPGLQPRDLNGVTHQHVVYEIRRPEA